jgi:CDGSH-type Zn-finger protein
MTRGDQRAASAGRSAAETVITPYRDGPLLVRGPVRIQDQEGREIVVERDVVALCRCGKSRARPLCDGTHKLIRFQAPSGLEQGARKGPHTNGLASPGVNGIAMNGRSR